MKNLTAYKVWRRSKPLFYFQLALLGFVTLAVAWALITRRPWQGELEANWLAVGLIGGIGVATEVYERS